MSGPYDQPEQLSRVSLICFMLGGILLAAAAVVDWFEWAGIVAAMACFFAAVVLAVRAAWIDRNR